MILQNPILIELVKLWASLCVAFVSCPLLFLALVCIYVSFFLLLPFICSVIWAVFLLKILFIYPIRFAEMKLVNFYSSVILLISGGNKKRPKCGEVMSRINEEEADDDQRMKQKQVSLELDPMEFPCLCETDEDGDDDDDEAGKKVGGKGMVISNNGFVTYEEYSWQILIPKSIEVIEEYKPVSFGFLISHVQRNILFSYIRNLLVKDCKF